MPPSSPHDLQAFPEPTPFPAMAGTLPAQAAPPLGIRPSVDRFGKPAVDGEEPIVTPLPRHLVAPLRDGLRLDRLEQLGRRVRLPGSGLLGKARA